MVPAYGPKSAYVMELDLLCRSEVKVSVSCIKFYGAVQKAGRGEGFDCNLRIWL